MNTSDHNARHTLSNSRLRYVNEGADVWEDGANLVRDSSLSREFLSAVFKGAQIIGRAAHFTQAIRPGCIYRDALNFPYKSTTSPCSFRRNESSDAGALPPSISSANEITSRKKTR